MIGRAVFLKGAGAAAAAATGGLDVWAGDAPTVRVVVGTDTRGETPQVLSDGTFTYGGKRWRGAPSVIPQADGRTLLVTTLDVDDYLLGVVPLEAPPSWPAAALEAQAIVARTFALGRRTLSRPYDLVATEADQRWGGVEAETAATTRAVRTTRGAVLSFMRAPAAVFYSACCGGHTADIAAAWNGVAYPYLRGVADPYCTPAPDYRWERAAPLERVLAAFGSRTGGSVSAVALTDPDPSGRPRTVVLSGSTTANVPVAEFRRALGSDVVRSPWLLGAHVDATQAAPRLLIEGAGRGHGVGLCQWGARFFASSGASAPAILAYYFPGTQLSG